MTAENVCRILEVCAITKVSLLKFGGLHVEFGISAEKAQQGLTNLTQSDHDKQNAAQIREDAEFLRQMEIDNLALESPLLYEEMLAKGEI